MTSSPDRAPAQARRPVPTLTAWTTAEIRRRIVLGELAPGARVPLEHLATELAISRLPLREAVRQLEAEGLIVNIPRRGAVVSEYDEQDVVDAYRLLETIEVLAVERAAKQSDRHVAHEMRRWLEVMRNFIAAAASDEMLEAHRNFHFALFEGVGEGVLLRHLRMLWYECERYVMATMPNRERADSAFHEHQELVEFVEAGDAKGAIKLLRRHLRSSLASVRGKLFGPGAIAATDGDKPGAPAVAG